MVATCVVASPVECYDGSNVLRVAIIRGKVEKKSLSRARNTEGRSHRS